jgi:hypothetical protein
MALRTAESLFVADAVKVLSCFVLAIVEKKQFCPSGFSKLGENLKREQKILVSPEHDDRRWNVAHIIADHPLAFSRSSKCEASFPSLFLSAFVIQSLLSCSLFLAPISFHISTNRAPVRFKPLAIIPGSLFCRCCAFGLDINTHLSFFGIRSFQDWELQTLCCFCVKAKVFVVETEELAIRLHPKTFLKVWRSLL